MSAKRQRVQRALEPQRAGIFPSADPAPNRPLAEPQEPGHVATQQVASRTEAPIMTELMIFEE